MGFGIKVEAPKVEAPKVEVPKVDVAASVNSAVSGVTGAVSGAVDSAKSAVNGAVDSAKSTVDGAVGAVTGAVSSAVDTATSAVESIKESLSSVAGAIAEVAVSFTGAIEDIVLEPHLSLDANASWGDTKFEKGAIRIRVEHTPEEAKTSTDTLHVSSESGEYDKSMSLNQFVDDNGRTVLLVFDDAPMDKCYSLEVVHADGSRQVMFRDVPYGDLRNTKQRYV